MSQSFSAKITLDKERNLLLDMNAMAEFEKETGKSLMNGASLKEMSAGDFRALLWACLVHEDESLTVKQVGSLVHAGNLAGVSNAIVQAFEAAMPEPEGNDQSPLTESRSVG